MSLFALFKRTNALFKALKNNGPLISDNRPRKLLITFFKNQSKRLPSTGRDPN